MPRKGSGNERVSRIVSAVGIHFRRGKQRVSRLFSRWNSSVYSSVSTSRNPDFDLGVDSVDTFLGCLKNQTAFFICLIVCTISVSADGNGIPQQSGLSFQCRIAEILRSCKHFSCFAVALPSVAHICRCNAIGIQA